MNGLDIAMAEFFVVQVSFLESGILEITYLKKDEQIDGLGMVHTLSIQVTGDDEIGHSYSELQGLLRNVVDRGEEVVRNPPTKIQGGNVISRVRDEWQQNRTGVDDG